MLPIIKKSSAECMGVFALVFIGCGLIMLQENSPEAAQALSVPVAFGMVTMVMVYALGHISGAHLNPAVSLAFALTKRFPWKEWPWYVSAQLAGAAAAVALLGYLLPETGSFGQTIPTVGAGKALIWEIVLTWLLMFVIMAVATDSRATGVMAGMAIGGIVTLNATIGGPFSGASMNPARSFGPALASGQWHTLWIYIVGPCVGATLGALHYEFLRCHTTSTPRSTKGCC